MGTYKIVKTIYGKNTYNSNNDNEFSELKKPLERYTPNQFFQIYNKLFYNIPKAGGNSHEELIQKSSAYVNKGVDVQQARIDALIEEIGDLQNQLSATEPEHPFFPNGSLVSNPNYEHNTDIQPQAYVMERGQLRAIMWWGQHRYLRSVLGYNERFGGSWEGTGWEGYLHPTQDMIDKIPKGPPIFTDDDLFLNEEFYGIPKKFTTFLDIQAGLNTAELSEGQVVVLAQILEKKEAEMGISGENDAGAIAVMDLLPLIDDTVAKYNATLEQATDIVKKAQNHIISGNQWSLDEKQKSIERGNTWFRQMISGIAFILKQEGKLNY